MTLQQLTYFLAAAQHGSFTAAADVLQLARPSVSEQIAHLEAELGVALFVRAGRRLELTDAGRLLRPEAERTLAAAGEASDVVRRARTLVGGTASLGTFSTAEHLLLPALVEDFAQRHPEVAIRVVGQNSSELADAVRAGRLEAGLVALPIDDDGLAVSACGGAVRGRLRERAPRRAPSRDHRAARPGRPRAPGSPLGRRGSHSPAARRTRPARGITIRPRIEVQHAHAALELAARGLADTLVTRALVDGLGYGDRLTGVPLDPPLHEAFAFITRRNVRLSPATRALMALAEHHLARRSDERG